MIESYYDTEVSVLRLAPDAENEDQEQYAAHLSGVRAHIQPLDDSYNEDLSGNEGKESLMFCEPSDIKENDRVVDAEGNGYRVVAVESFAFLDEDQHMELRIRRSLIG